jgi:imidazole glycerol-phosphate synthase subunit HisH
MIAIVRYNAGNIKSVQNSVSRLGYESVITDNKEDLLAADKVILPGVGEASSAMNYIRERQLDKVITSLTKPVLGICLGLQLLCLSSEEGDTKCLGIFDTHVKKLPPKGKVPHTGWNNFTWIQGDLLDGIDVNDDVYYVHSYYSGICRYTNAVCDYILPFSASMRKGNFYALQFHPEKSSVIGEKVMKNFLEL